MVGTEIRVGSGGRDALLLGYLADRDLSSDAVDLLGRQLRLALSSPGLDVELTRVPTDTLLLQGTAADTTRLREVADVMHRFDGLDLMLMSDTSTAAVAEAADSTAMRLGDLGIASERVRRQSDGNGPLRMTFDAEVGR
jgi:hypothetical protein